VKPLEGVRVLDLTRLLPGAYATLLLADLGADVIKIEDPRGGDTMRQLPAHSHRDYFALLNRNKKSVTLDLRLPDARWVLDALLTRVDVIVDSFRPSTARRLRVDAATLQANHPRLICASISGFGQIGPYANRAAHDINYQALAGLLSTQKGRVPTLPGPLVGDIGSAMTAAMRILAALIERQRSGTGSVVDVSIHDSAIAWAMFPTTGDLASACYNIYETADGEYLALGALEPKFWRAFCERLERPDLVARQHDRGEAVSELRHVMRTRTLKEWLALVEDADVCLTPVYTPEEVAADAHVSSRATLATNGIAPALGADTDDELERAGIDSTRRAALRRAGVI
jgi:alpha-methylacyl-CoA racemase